MRLVHLEMAVGDVGALDRIERQDRRADRASRKLIKKLAKKQRNLRLGPVVTVHAPQLQDVHFSPCARLVTHSNTAAVQRRASRARGPDDRRAFLVMEASSADEECNMVLAMPRTGDATIDLLTSAICKSQISTHAPPSTEVLLLQAAPDGEATLGGQTGGFVTVCKVRLPGKDRVFYARCSQSAPTASPRELGLDHDSFARLQRAATRLTGWKLNNPGE